MRRVTKFMRTMALAATAAAALLLASGNAVADKLHLKDGSVLEGTVEKQGDGYVYFKVVIGGIEHVQFYTAAQYTRIEKTSTPTDEEDDSVEKDDAEEDRDARPAGAATRVAILNFGAPSNWNGEIGDTVGIQISAKAWKDAVPLLEEDDVDVVVVRINSGGGMLLELEKFFDVYEQEYKPHFRTVAWVESAISCAAMSPWCLEEFYMMKNGNIGACTGWSGQLVAMKGWGLEEVIYLMERISTAAGRDSKIMRSMQVMDPLSCDIDEETGEVTWYQNLDGDYVVNPEERILTFNARDAVKFKFAKAIADTRDELREALGLEEVEWVGDKAAAFIDENMRQGDRTSNRLGEIWTKYQDAIAFAQGTEDRRKRGAMVSRARRWLHEIRRMVSVNPNFTLMYGTTDEWFEQQEELLDDLMD